MTSETRGQGLALVLNGRKLGTVEGASRKRRSVFMGNIPRDRSNVHKAKKDPQILVVIGRWADWGNLARPPVPPDT